MHQQGSDALGVTLEHFPVSRYRVATRSMHKRPERIDGERACDI